MPMLPKVVRAGVGPHNLGSGDNRGDTFPELAVQYDPGHTKSDDEYLGRRSVPTAGDTGSEEDYDHCKLRIPGNPLLRVAARLLNPLNGRTPMLYLY